MNAWYQTSQIGNRSLEFIRYAVNVAKKPFVAYLGPHAPHYSADSPPWARDMFKGEKAPRTPAYNTSEGQAFKTRHVMQNPPWQEGSDMEAHIDIHFRDRWRAIVGVDEMVRLLVTELEEMNILESTYIFLTSDHGYKLGEWRVGCSKQHPYETDVHIPFFARGPGIAPGTRLTSLGSNIDIAPTFIAIAGLPPNPEHDGKSLLPLLHAHKDPQWRTSQLIEYISVGTYYNDHAKLWLSGPAEHPGTPVVYGEGPYEKPSPRNFSKPECKNSETNTTGEVGQGQCWFVDSQASNNWIALRVRNLTHNYVYVESFGSNAVAHPTFKGEGVGVFKCMPGDLCQYELYDYGPMTSDYPDYPVMKRERWNIDNIYQNLSETLKTSLHEELKEAYCSSKRLDVDRMGC